MKDMWISRHNPPEEANVTLEIIQPEKKPKINLQCKVGTGVQSNILPIRLLRIISPGSLTTKEISNQKHWKKMEPYFQHMVASLLSFIVKQ